MQRIKYVALSIKQHVKQHVELSEYEETSSTVDYLVAKELRNNHGGARI